MAVYEVKEWKCQTFLIIQTEKKNEEKNIVNFEMKSVYTEEQWDQVDFIFFQTAINLIW